LAVDLIDRVIVAALVSGNDIVSMIDAVDSEKANGRRRAAWRQRR
jgi:hypothetical protein